MIDLLKVFYENEHERETVKYFLLREMDKYALETVYNKEDTKSIAQAKEVIDRAFIELEERYKKQKVVEVTNPAR